MNWLSAIGYERGGRDAHFAPRMGRRAGDEGGSPNWRSAPGRILVLLIILFGAAPLTLARAQDGVEDAVPAAIPGLAVAENDATVEFPDGITFTLDAETTDPIANVELMYWTPGMDTLSVELPPFDDGATELDIEHPIDLGAGVLPPGLDVEYQWRITEDDGDIVETSEQTVSWTDDRYAWTPLTGPHVTVYTYDADPAFQTAILETAERTIANLAEAYETELEQPVRIWAYTSTEEFYGALAPNFDPHAAAVNYPPRYLIQAVLPNGNYDEVKRVIPHEISHQVLYQATDNPFNALYGPPDWLDEGLANYWQEAGRDRLYSRALELAATGDVPPLRTLNGSFPYDREGLAAGYAFSLTVVMYILDTWGDEGMSRLLATFDEGITYDDAIQEGLGISFDELDRRWREDLIADAQQLGAAGSTRFNDGGAGGSSPWSSFGEGLVLAAESVLLGLVILIALIAGLVSVVRARRQPEPDEEEVDGVRWGEWPAGLEPTGWQHENVHGQRGW